MPEYTQVDAIKDSRRVMPRISFAYKKRNRYERNFDWREALEEYLDEDKR